MNKIKSIMRKKVITVNVDDPVDMVCTILINNKLSGLPVVNKSMKLLGYVSEKDIIASMNRKPKSKNVKGVMNKKVFSIKETTTINEVSKIFAEKAFRRIPIVRGGKLVGMISREDIVAHLIGTYY